MRPPSPASAVVNGVAIDLQSETLRAPDGTPRTLRPQTFAVLRHLIANPDRLVTKDELMDAVWHGVAVTDDSLVQCIHEIRRAIDDDAHAVLVNVPRRGYRLVVGRAAGEAGGRSRRAWAAAILGGAAVALMAAWPWREPAPAAPPLMAVLPFEPLAEDPSATRLARGLTEDLITDLARFPEFSVLSAGTTEGLGRDADPRRLGAELGARFVIAGSIDREADGVRITAQLTDATDGSNLWSDRWERPAEDFFAVQGEIAEAIANRLGGGAGLVQETGRNAARRKPPSSLTAYELYLLGTERLEQLTRPELEAALDLLTRAVELDPGLARGWIELYHTHELLSHLGVEPDRNRALADAAAERALALDPGDPEAHAVHGSSLGMRGDFVRAEAAYETALRLAPNAAEILIFYIGWASAFGKPERGADLVERAIRLDPHYPAWANRPFAVATFMAGRPEQAVGFFERLGTERHNRWSWSAHAGALAALGRHEEAADLVARALAEHPDLSIEAILNEPGWSEAERARFVETMRLAGFPACALPRALPDGARRLPECVARAEAPAPPASVP